MGKKKALTFDIEADEVELFLQDANELLQAMEDGILHLEQGADLETLNAVFRAAHTLKAMAGTVGHYRMSDLTHAVETLFDEMRESRLSPTAGMVDELLQALDALKALRDEVVSRKPSGVDVETILSDLRALSEGGGGSEGRESTVTRQLTPEQAEMVSDLYEAGRTILEIEVIVRPDAFAPAARLLQAAMGLAEMGRVVAQQPLEEELVQDKHSGCLWLVLATGTDVEAVEMFLGNVFDLAEFHVQPYMMDVSSPLSAVPSPTTVSADVPSVEGVGVDKTVRISVGRLDTLMNLVGELVTDRTRLLQIEGELHAWSGRNGTVESLEELTTHFGRVVDQLQEEVMRARMLPISHLFDKLPRLVRDVARAAGKQINLVISGRATELDRAIIEAIGDPLVHLLRNAADHGIESPEERVATGKSPTGNVWLSAAHEEGQIVVTVEDDGRGVDLERVRQAAVRRGLFSEEEAAQLGSEDVMDLIFLPNISTVEHVTEVSGRGVGLDVVRTNIQRLGGSVMVESAVGNGTVFRLTLPLTLAIVQTMLVAVGEDVYAVPMTSIVDSLYLSDVKVSTVKGTPTILWRDTVLPILDMRRFFDHPRLAHMPANGNRPAVVTVAWGRLRLGLVVEKIIGKQEIVVKSFSPIVGKAPGLSGCTILGDGRIALIVDVPGLINVAVQSRREEVG